MSTLDEYPSNAKEISPRFCPIHLHMIEFYLWIETPIILSVEDTHLPQSLNVQNNHDEKSC